MDTILVYSMDEDLLEYKKKRAEIYERSTRDPEFDAKLKADAAKKNEEAVSELIEQCKLLDATVETNKDIEPAKLDSRDSKSECDVEPLDGSVSFRNVTITNLTINIYKK